MITEDTITRAAEATALFHCEDGYNRRQRRSPEAGVAVRHQFERVYDIVASEAIILCDGRGRSLKHVGSNQLCRLLAQSVPSIISNSPTKDVGLRALEILRPNIDWSNIAIKPIAVPKKRNRLFIASVSESQFNPAGVEHASVGIKRILGIPSTETAIKSKTQRLWTSRDRLAFDVSRAMTEGFHWFNCTALSARLRQPRRFGAPKRLYYEAIAAMLAPVQERLAVEGLRVDRPRRFGNFNGRRGRASFEGYRSHRIELPVRIALTGRQRGTLVIEFVGYHRQFEIAGAPKAELYIDA